MTTTTTTTRTENTTELLSVNDYNKASEITLKVIDNTRKSGKPLDAYSIVLHAFDEVEAYFGRTISDDDKRALWSLVRFCIH